MADGLPILPDGTTDFSGGQNAAIDPAAIKPNQYFIGVNVSAEEGFLKPRWGIHHIHDLDFSPAGDYTRESGFVISFEEIFYSGKFQAFVPYTIGPDKFALYIVSGFIFIINIGLKTVDVLNKTDQLNVWADRVNWSNAGRFLVTFDFPNRPFILEGIQIHRSDPTLYEVPVSVLGTNNQNRLAIANAGIDWTAGDPSGSPSTPDAPVTFQEVLLPSTGFTGDVYQVPTANKNNDTITAMGFIQVLDKSTGIGPLFVATNNSIYSYPTDLPRAEWQGGATSRVFGSLLLRTGINGQRDFTNVNSDFVFRAPDAHIYCLTASRNDQFKWANFPISREVKNFLKLIDPSLQFVGAMTHFKNKIFATVNPHRVGVTSSEGVPQTDYVNSGLVVIEGDNMATLSNQTPPAWAGAWTGVDFMDLAVIDQKLYTAAKINGRNALCLIDDESTYDMINGKKRYVQSMLFTKEYVTQDATINKKIHSLDLGLRKLQEKVNVKVAYKPETMENYTPWRDFDVCAPVEQCEALPKFPNGLAPQGIRDLNIGGVDDTTCNAATDELLYLYKGVQVRLIITGKYWELKYIKLKSVVVPQTENNPYCVDCNTTPIPYECFNIWDVPKTDEC